MAGIHAGKSQLGVAVDGGQDIALVAVYVADNRIQADQEARTGLFLKISNSLPFDRERPFSVDSGLFLRMIVESGALDNALYFPTSKRQIIRIEPTIKGQKLELAIAEILPTQFDHAFILERRIFPLSPVVGCAGTVFQGTEIGLVKQPLPLIEGLGRKAEVPGHQRYVLTGFGLIENKPVQTTASRLA